MLNPALALLVVTSLSASPGMPPEIYTPQELWDAWPGERFVEQAAPCLSYDDLVASMHALHDLYPDDLTLDAVGESFEGRDIYLMTLGTGPRKVLLWSQMHGDEPSATPALLDMAHFLLSRRGEGEPRASRILDELTLLMVPRLNPDGSEDYQRRNAQGIDVNRDALNLATPEGVLLKSLRDRHLPILGFNLHDMDRDHTVGDTGVLATNALLAVTGDAENTLTPGRLRAKRACSAIAEALAHVMPGGMSRYDETWSPRSFGDNITAWGTPVALLESGGLPPGRPFEDLSRLNFVGLLRALEDLARDDLAGHDPAVYDGLPDNADNEWVDAVVRGGRLLQPGTGKSYRADLAFMTGRSDQELAGCAEEPLRRASRITEVGDARLVFAGRDLDADDALVTAPLVVAAHGFDAGAGLLDATADGLRRLARLGIGTVVWYVEDGDRAAAVEHAEAHDLAGLPRVLVRVASADGSDGGESAGPALSLPDLEDAETAGVGASLRDVLALLGSSSDTGSDSDSVEASEAEELLGRLGVVDPVGRGGLFQGRAASFLLWSPLVDGRVDPERTALRAVWIDGREVAGDE